MQQNQKIVSHVRRLQATESPVAVAASLGVPTYTHSNAFNILNLAFWYSTGDHTEALKAWTCAYELLGTRSPWGDSTSEIQKAWILKFHEAGVKVLVSAFGADLVTKEGDPISIANALANFVKLNHLDGVDVYWSDTETFDEGQGETWLITFTTTLRNLLPANKGYVLSHSPQAKYFNPSLYPKGAYISVHKSVGHMIDFYNVQYYDQGTSAPYSTYESLFVSGGASVREIISHGVPPSKIVLGKPFSPDGANNGFVPLDDLFEIVSQGAHELGGVMGWQFASDSQANGEWSLRFQRIFHTPIIPPPTHHLDITSDDDNYDDDSDDNYDDDSMDSSNNHHYNNYTNNNNSSSSTPFSRATPKDRSNTLLSSYPSLDGAAATDTYGAVVTVIHGSNVKRFVFPDCEYDRVAVSEVIRLVKSMMTRGEICRLFWVDDEGDVCRVDGSNEWIECMRVCGGRVWPLILFTTAMQARASVVTTN